MSHTNLILLASMFSVAGFTVAISAIDRAASAFAAYFGRKSLPTSLRA